MPAGAPDPTFSAHEAAAPPSRAAASMPSRCSCSTLWGRALPPSRNSAVWWGRKRRGMARPAVIGWGQGRGSWRTRPILTTHVPPPGVQRDPTKATLLTGVGDGQGSKPGSRLVVVAGAAARLAGVALVRLAGVAVGIGPGGRGDRGARHRVRCLGAPGGECFWGRVGSEGLRTETESPHLHGSFAEAAHAFKQQVKHIFQCLFH